MISINYISKFLSEKQVSIDNIYYTKINKFEKNKDVIIDVDKDKHELDKYELNLADSFNVLFNKSIIDFYYDNRFCKNKSLIFTLINSLLNIGNITFNLYDIFDKEIIIKDFIKKIDSDLFQLDLYNKFNYNKNKRFNKSDIQFVLKNAIQFKYCDKINLLKEYISDYLGINIYILKIENGQIDYKNCEYFLTQKYGKNINKFLPHYILLHENEIYKPLLACKKELNNSSVLTYSAHKDIIDNIWNYFRINDLYVANDKLRIIENAKSGVTESVVENVTESVSENVTESVTESVTENVTESVTESVTENVTESIQNKKYKIEILKDLKIDTIKNLCKENSIDLLKKSDKTSKMINKIKIDLINDLLMI